MDNMEEKADAGVMTEEIDAFLKKMKESEKINKKDYIRGEKMYLLGSCQVLTHGKSQWEVLIDIPDEEAVELKIETDGEDWFCLQKKKTLEWGSWGIAALLQVKEELNNTTPQIHPEGRTYTREGMMKRVLEERQEKALKADYKIKFADNIYGEHTLTNEKGIQYKITLRDFENETGYIDNPDLQSNKLGTTKHIMYAFNTLKSRKRTFNKLSKTYPFIEIFLDPLNDYRITWFYPHKLRPNVQKLRTKYFGEKNYIEEEAVKDFLLFIRDAREFPKIKIRPEVEEKVQKAWDEEMLETVRKTEKLDYSLLHATLFPYQKKGVEFAVFKKGAIIADEMGLGKTLQAIAAAVMKKKLFGFKKCLIICPASLKEQWKREINRFCEEEAVVVQGFPEERKQLYEATSAYFLIANYETVLRDVKAMNKMDTDFIILDEAQRIKNYSTVTAQNIKKLHKKHALVITGTPIENRLTDLYSVMQFVDPDFLTPLWEFSYQHCYFDTNKKDKIVGYYNLKQLNERLKSVLLRREKRTVLKELPNLTEMTVPVNLHPDQADYHSSFAAGVAAILRKKFISPYDWQKLMLLLNNMRMACDSTYLIDKETYHSPKLVELEHILIEKLDIKNSSRKIIIFSEWVTMLNLIGKMLRENGIGYAQLTGKVAVKNRGKLVKKFETEPSCQVFLSSEAGGSGLNLQVADTVINFELPWNPAKKNQRIGRIDRLGQRNKQLTVINLLTRDSIEMKIASGLTLKQNLFDGVLSDNGMDEVDFSASGRAEFLMELEAVLDGLVNPETPEEEDQDATVTSEEKESLKALIEEEEKENADESLQEEKKEAPSRETPAHTETMESILNNGMEFLSGLMKMATGKDTGLENKKVEIDKETGEVVMRFKLPGM